MGVIGHRTHPAVTMKKIYCYILEAGPFVKIGYSKDIEKRVAELQTGNPHQISVIAKFPCHTVAIAQQMEADMHYKFRRHRANGEWFKKRPVLKYFRMKGDNMRIEMELDLETLSQSPL